MGAAPADGTDDEGHEEIVELTGRLVCTDLHQAATVRRHLPEHVALTRAEPGCLRFAVEPTEDPLIWTVSEQFADRDAFEAHQARVRSSAWFEATSEIARDYAVTTAGSGPAPMSSSAAPDVGGPRGPAEPRRRAGMTTP